MVPKNKISDLINMITRVIREHRVSKVLLSQSFVEPVEKSILSVEFVLLKRDWLSQLHGLQIEFDNREKSE